jgi:general secretion pathway protein D
LSSGTPGGPDKASGVLSGAGARPAGGNAILQNVRITADITNNAALVYANQESQRIVEQTIRQIDRPQHQIAIEATIADVTLNDQLNYGVQFFLASQKGSIVNTVATAPGATHTVDPPSNAVNAAAGALPGLALPGFNFLIGSENSQRVVLDALHNVTDVKVLSNPSLVVLDNQAATLQVGDQVPFSTGTATVLTANNTVVKHHRLQEHRHHSAVLPCANANGHVVLDIEQQISSVAAGTAAGSLTSRSGE